MKAGEFEVHLRRQYFGMVGIVFSILQIAQVKGGG